MKSRLHLLLFATAATLVSRADTTWTGGTNSNWNVAANWSAGIPLNSTALNTVTIGANLNLNMNNNLVGGNQLTGLVLNGTPGSNVVIGGNQLNLHSGGINMTGAGVNLTFNNELDVLINQPWVIEGGRTLETIDVDGNFDAILSRAGAGTATYRISGPGDNNAHRVIVGDGVLVELNKASNAGVHAVGGALTVNSGGIARNTGTGGDQIYNGMVPTINGTGVYDLNGIAEGLNGINGNGIVNNTSASPVTLTLGESNGGGTFSGSIQNTGGAVSVVKIGGGTMTLSGSNSYTGGTTVNNGYLRVSTDAGLGAVPGSPAVNLTLNGGVLQNNDSNVSLNANRTISLGASGGNFRVGWTNRELVVNGQVTGPGFLRNVNDSSRLVLANPANDYNGDTIVGSTTFGTGTSARLWLGASEVLPHGSGKGNLAFDPGVGGTATLDMRGFSETVNGLTLTSGNGIIENSLASTTSTLTIGANNAGSTYAGLIRNNGGTGGTVALTKTGNGTITLSGANAYTGATTISAGTLRLQGVAFSTAARSYSIASGAVLNIDGNTGYASGTTSVSGDGTLRVTNGNFGNESPNSPAGSGRNMTLSLGGPGTIDIQSGAFMRNGGWANVTWTSNLADMNVDGTFDLWDGQLVKVDALTGSGTLVKNLGGGSGVLEVGVNNGSGTFSGNAGNAFSLLKSGAGTQTLSGAADNSGLIATVNAGTLVLAKTSSPTVHALGSGATGLTINSGGTAQLGGTGGDQIYTQLDTVLNAGGVFDLNGRSEGFDSLTGGGTVRNTAAATTSTLTLGENNGGGAFTGLIENGSGTVALTKAGTGQINLSGPNTYSGVTTVNAGILAAFSNSALGSAAGGSVVNSGGSLQLEGGVTIAAEPVTLTGTGWSGTRGALASWSGANFWNGPVTLAGNSTIFVQADSLTIGGNIGGAGVITKTGAGTLNLTGTGSTHTSPTQVNGGLLLITTGSEQTLGNNPVGFNGSQLSLNGSTLQVATASLTLDDSNRGVSVGASGGTFNVDPGLTFALSNTLAANAVGSTLTKTGTGTFDLTGSAQINALVVDQGAYRQGSGTTRILTTSTGLEIRNGGTYLLAGGTLKTDRVNVLAGGTFDWGSGTLTLESTSGNAGVTDYSNAGYQAVLSGVTGDFTGDLATTAGSTLALHGSPTLYLNAGVRFNNWEVDGDFDLSAAGDTLELELNPYLLRPFSSAGIAAIETGSLPLVTWTGAFGGGEFDSVTGVNLTQGGGFAPSAFSVSDPALLDPNTWYIEYDAAASTVWLHYKVTGYVPEPASFSLLVLGAAGLRLARTLRSRQRMLDRTAA